MTFDSILSFCSAVLCCGLGAFVLFRDLRSFAHRTFALGMFCLAAERTINGLGAFTVLPEEVLHWRQLGVLAGALLPGIWLLFSLSFGRANYREFIAKWKWAAVTAFALPLAMATLFNQSFFAGSTFPVESTRWVLPLGWSGYFFYLFFLVGSVTVLMNLEGTLRGFTGSVRWQIKFMVLGVGGLFAARIYTTSQTLLFSSVNTALDVVDSGALIVAAALIVVALVRLRILNTDLYLSQTLLYKSVTVSVVGLYLLAVGILAKLVDYLGGIHALVLVTFIVFLGLLGLVIVLLADELRQKVKLFINRNLRRPQYDYRKEWMRFTQRTASVVDINCLSASVAAMVSETFGVACVTLWLRDEVQDHVSMYGSTVFPASENANMAPVKKAAADLIHAMQYQQSPIDLDQCEADWARDFKRVHEAFLKEAQVRYCILLASGQQWLGVMTLSHRLNKIPFSVEDFDLLKIFADQSTANLLNLRLSGALLQAKEMEAFQSISAFFIHDLKNLASQLSMTMQNLPAHFDKPAFRKDALRVISQSVERMNAMCSGLSLANKKLELHRTKTDLNLLVTNTLSDLNESMKVPVVLDLRPTPELLIDPEQIQKVLVNLVLNAHDAVEGKGEVQVVTGRHNGWIELSVSDNGRGMPAEFIAQSLFRPFRTTKKQGLGVGLFHSKKIVESHRGTIEVESEEGKGSTFRVLLPASDH